MANVRSVLRVNAVEEAAAYRTAVSQILRNILNDEELTLAEVAEIIDASLGTVSNAFNKKADLNAIYLNRLGKAFGAHVLEPYAKLCDGCIVPATHGEHADVLPILLNASTQIASARDPQSPGGVVETLRERLGYLPSLRRARREIDALITAIEHESGRAAA